MSRSFRLPRHGGFIRASRILGLLIASGLIGACGGTSGNPISPTTSTATLQAGQTIPLVVCPKNNFALPNLL